MTNNRRFMVVDTGSTDPDSHGRIGLTRRFSPRGFATRASADRFVMSLPRRIRRDVMVVPVSRTA